MLGEQVRGNLIAGMHEEVDRMSKLQDVLLGGSSASTSLCELQRKLEGENAIDDLADREVSMLLDQAVVELQEGAAKANRKVIDQEKRKCQELRRRLATALGWRRRLRSVESARDKLRAQKDELLKALEAS